MIKEGDRMAEIIIMPKLGFNMSTGKLVKWYKKEGDPIKKGENFFSVETDKTNMDIEATSDGYVKKQFISEGDNVEVTLPIAIVGDQDENVEDLIAQALSEHGREETPEPAADIDNKAEEIQTSSESKMQNPGDIKLTPRARKAAKERNIDISSLNIQGTGYEGGICEADILAFEAQQPQKSKISPLANKMAEVEGIDPSAISGTGIGNKIMKKDVEAAMNKSNEPVEPAADEEVQYAPDGKEILETIPYSGVRRVIGERMVESKFTAPHLYFTKAVDLTNLLALRKQVNESQGTKTSVTDYIAKAAVKALQKYPEVNASLQGDQIITYKTVNLGIAVAADSGLIVPVVKDAEKKGLIEFSQAASGLFKKAREGKLMPEEYSGGTFTVSNLGMFGIDDFTAIINQPESAILAVSGTQKKPVVITNNQGEDEIAIRPMMNITLTVDHRLIDGLMAAQFVVEIKKYLETPLQLIL